MVCELGQEKIGMDMDLEECKRLANKREERMESTFVLKKVAARNKLKFVARWGRLVHARYSLCE